MRSNTKPRAGGSKSAASARISYFGDFATNSLTGGNDIVLYGFSGTQLPEPNSGLLLLLGMAALLRRKRAAK